VKKNRRPGVSRISFCHSRITKRVASCRHFLLSLLFTIILYLLLKRSLTIFLSLTKSHFFEKKHFLQNQFRSKIKIPLVTGAEGDTQRARSVVIHEPVAPEITHFLHPARTDVMYSHLCPETMVYRPVTLTGKFSGQILSRGRHSTCTYDIRATKLTKRMCSDTCQSHTDVNGMCVGGTGRYVVYHQHEVFFLQNRLLVR